MAGFPSPTAGYPTRGRGEHSWFKGAPGYALANLRVFVKFDSARGPKRRLNGLKHPESWYKFPMPHAGGRPRKWPAGMSRAEVRRIRRQQRKLTPPEQPIPMRIREGMLTALDELSRQHQCDYLVEIHKQLAEAAKNGNIAATREVYDRLEGRPTQAIEVAGKASADALAIETLRAMPPEAALEQLDGALVEISRVRQEFLAACKTVNVEPKWLPMGSQADTAGPEWAGLGFEDVVILDGYGGLGGSEPDA